MDQPAYKISQKGDTVTVSPQQPVVSSQQFKLLLEEITPRVTTGDAVNVVFDMSHVEYLDSACAARLISLLQPVKAAEGRVMLAHCQPNVRFLLKMSKLDTIFEMFDSIDDAMDRLRDTA